MIHWYGSNPAALSVITSSVDVTEAKPDLTVDF